MPAARGQGPGSGQSHPHRVETQHQEVLCRPGPRPGRYWRVPGPDEKHLSPRTESPRASRRDSHPVPGLRPIRTDRRGTVGRSSRPPPLRWNPRRPEERGGQKIPTQLSHLVIFHQRQEPDGSPPRAPSAAALLATSRATQPATVRVRLPTPSRSAKASRVHTRGDPEAWLVWPGLSQVRGCLRRTLRQEPGCRRPQPPPRDSPRPPRPSPGGTRPPPIQLHPWREGPPEGLGPPASCSNPPPRRQKEGPGPQSPPGPSGKCLPEAPNGVPVPASEPSPSERSRGPPPGRSRE